MPGSVSFELFGKIRSQILGLLLTHPDETYYLREIARRIAASPGTVQRELEWLTQLRLLRRTTRGPHTYYQADASHPLFPELQRLMVKTVGAGDIIHRALLPLQTDIRVAFLYGSFASGEIRGRSDIDLLIIGNVSFSQIAEALSPAQQELGREINPAVYSVEEFAAKLGQKHHFLSSVMQGPKVLILGTQDELTRLASTGMDRGAPDQRR
ncbi:MAG: nucleotidyltransferase domain-containing protein [Chlamydiota bacterium]